VFLDQCFFDHGKFHPVISLTARPCTLWVANRLRVRARAACRTEITSDLKGGDFSIVKFRIFGGDPSIVTLAAFYVV